jgi:tetratricopeptide (TPR) repeat protein
MKPTFPVAVALLLTHLLAAGVAAQEPAGPADPEELERRADEAFIADELDTAAALYRQLASRLAEKEEKLRVLTTVAWIEHLAGDEGAALATLTDALLLDPSYPFRDELYDDPFRDLFYEAQARAVAEREARASERTREGREAMRRRDWAAAREGFEAALEIRPGHPRAVYNLALVELYEGNDDAAEEGLQRFLALADAGDGKPGDGRSAEITPEMRAKALTNLGYVYIRRQQYGEAEEALDRATTLDPGDAATWLNLGVTRRRLGKRELAADAFRRAYELAPDNADAASNLALALLDAGDWAGAEELLRPAAEGHPDDPHLWLQLGRAQAGAGRGEAAARSFETAIANDPGDAAGVASSAALQLAVLHYAAGRPGPALEQAERVLEWRPGQVHAWIYKGLAQKALGDPAAAKESLEEARRLDPLRAETHNNLGSVYYQLGELAAARQAFERALELDPGLADARANLEAVAQAERTGVAPGTPATGTPPPPPSAPAAPAPGLGLRFADVDYSALGLRGAMVSSVAPGSPAERAGIAANDLILKVDGRDVGGPGDLRDYVRGRPRGATVVLDLLRANMPRRVEVRLE